MDPHEIALRVLEFIVLAAVVAHLGMLALGVRFPRVRRARRRGGWSQHRSWRRRCKRSLLWLNVLLSLAYIAVLALDLDPDASTRSCCTSSGHFTVITLALRTLTYSGAVLFEARQAVRRQGGLGLALGVAGEQERWKWDVSDVSDVEGFDETDDEESFLGDSGVVQQDRYSVIA